ncbi:hypothetical protein D9615_005839 [Tricholomella constricta]|uniref:Uncharacterized protein n=1 Tax=Tricholomella constricta TaxID=117010 RepID=A0A8H5M3Q7_9AGAR|nr:hypothetical protein D9615_005839 [Tricholomella constricta]
MADRDEVKTTASAWDGYEHEGWCWGLGTSSSTWRRQAGGMLGRQMTTAPLILAPTVVPTRWYRPHHQDQPAPATPPPPSQLQVFAQENSFSTHKNLAVALSQNFVSSRNHCASEAEMLLQW